MQGIDLLFLLCLVPGNPNLAQETNALATMLVHARIHARESKIQATEQRLCLQDEADRTDISECFCAAVQNNHTSSSVQVNVTVHSLCAHRQGQYVHTRYMDAIDDEDGRPAACIVFNSKHYDKVKESLVDLSGPSNFPERFVSNCECISDSS